MRKPSQHILAVQDRSRLFREGLAHLLGKDGAIQSFGLETVEELASVATDRRVDAALVEFEHLSAPREAVLAHLRRAGVRVVESRTMHEHDAARSAVATVARTATPEQIRAALMDEHPPLPTRERRARGRGTLTPREVQVLSLIGAGLGATDIARRLGISKKTVEGRRENILAKLEVQNQAHAVAIAVQRGLLGGDRVRDRVAPPRGRERVTGPYGRPILRELRLDTERFGLVVAHDHRWMGPLSASVLEASATLLGDTDSGEIAARLCEIFRPSVLLSSELLADGIIDTFLPRITRSGTRVLLLSEPLEKERTLRLVERGVVGFLDPSQSPAALEAGVREVAGGGALLPPPVMATIATEWRLARRGTYSGGQLTPREAEVLAAMVDGLTTKATAHRLGVTLKTVETHKTRVFAKLGVRTKSEAVSLVLEGHVATTLPYEPIGVRLGRLHRA